MNRPLEHWESTPADRIKQRRQEIKDMQNKMITLKKAFVDMKDVNKHLDNAYTSLHDAEQAFNEIVLKDK